MGWTQRTLVEQYGPQPAGSSNLDSAASLPNLWKKLTPRVWFTVM